MPQPWPAVSPDQTKLCARSASWLRRPVPDGAVLNHPCWVSPRVPFSSSKPMLTENRVPAGRWAALILAVKSLPSVAWAPLNVRTKDPRPRIIWPAPSTARSCARTRPSPELRAQSTALLVETSPMEKPLVNPKRERTKRGAPEANAAPVGPTRPRAPAPKAPVNKFRRETLVMALTVVRQASQFMAPR